MLANFAANVATWQSFFMLAGSASATLIGLLFVAVSLHIDLLGESGATAILTLARRTFTRFVLVVIVALVFLVPRQEPSGLGLPLLTLGAADALRTVWAARIVITELKRHTGLRDAVQPIMLPVVLPLVSSLGLILVASTVLAGTTGYLYWMVPIVALMLTNAATNSWDLMLGLAKYKLRRAGGASAGDVDTRGPDGGDGRDVSMKGHVPAK